ncbi:MAG: CAP domain-containing protein [Gammaproteobacteria bacterium]|nr:CAP domain-containing protein [Gammaproteobacteria bacterium]
MPALELPAVKNAVLQCVFYLIVLLSSQCFAIQVVDIHDREAVRNLFKTVYLAANGTEPQWIGDISECQAGVTSETYKQAILLRINYFRSMAGVNADVKFNPELNSIARSAALMMSANHDLSHTPSESWACFTKTGLEAAGRSNLGLGTHGYQAITLLMKDPGENNRSVGHRRWIIYPQTREMGTGNVIPDQFGFLPAHATVIQDDQVFLTRPETRDGFVSWPPPGYVPYQLVFPRWSFSYANADFSNSSIEMEADTGEAINLNVIFRSQPPRTDLLTAPENTISWEPGIDVSRVKGNSDVVYHVRVKDVIVEGVRQSFNYDVTAIDPDIDENLPVFSIPDHSFELFADVINLDHQWTTITQSSTPNPLVLIAGVPTSEGVQPGVIQVNTDADLLTIQLRFREWNYQDKLHSMEQAAYLFVEPGVYNFSDGTMIQVGQFDIQGNGAWKELVFDQEFAISPYVFTSLQTANGADTAALRVRQVSGKSFQVSLFEQESLLGSWHTREHGAYIAIVTPSVSEHMVLQADSEIYTIQLASRAINHNWSNVVGHVMRLEEETSFDAETAHVTEIIDVMVINDSMVFAQIVSEYGVDPVVIRRQ